MDQIASHPALIAAARFVGIFATTLYAGITVQRWTISDSVTFVEPIVTHAPNERVMAKQWYHGYHFGPYWVPPLIAPATLSNLYLALATTQSSPAQRNLYLLAAAGIFSILPITFLYMEPGINGASKWRVQKLLKDEGFHMPETSVFRPSSVRHGSTLASRRWAESTDMRELIVFWQKVNNFRWIIAGAAAIASGVATFAF